MNIYFTGIEGLVATEKSVARSVLKMRNESVEVLCKHLGGCIVTGKQIGRAHV